MTKTLFTLKDDEAKTVQEFFADENHGAMHWRPHDDGSLEVYTD